MSKLFDRLNTLSDSQLAECFGLAVPTARKNANGGMTQGELVLGFKSAQSASGLQNERVRQYKAIQAERLTERLKRAELMAGLAERYPTICEVCEVVGLIGRPQVQAPSDPFQDGIRKLGAQMAKVNAKLGKRRLAE